MTEYEFPKAGVYNDGTGRTVTVEKAKETKELEPEADTGDMYRQRVRPKGAGGGGGGASSGGSGDEGK